MDSRTLSSTSQPVSWHASRWQALRKSIRRQPVLQPWPGVGAGTGHHFTRDAFNTVSELFANQPRQDLDPVMDLLGMSQGHQANILDIIHIHKEAFTNVTKSRQCGAEGKTEVQRPMTSESQEQDFLGHCGWNSPLSSNLSEKHGLTDAAFLATRDTIFSKSHPGIDSVEWLDTPLWTVSSSRILSTAE